MKQRKQGTAGFTLVELIVVIAILGILAGVGTVAYTGYVKRANKAVDQQLVADIAYALELSAAAGDFGSVEPPARLGETDLGLIPIGYVKLSKDADCQVYGVGRKDEGGYEAAPDEGSVIAQALGAAFGDDYQQTLRLHSDWSDSTASYTGTLNLSNTTFIGDVDQLWDKVQEMSRTVVVKANQNIFVAFLLSGGTEFDSPYDSESSGYDVVSDCASPLYYLGLSQEGRSVYAQLWSEEAMGSELTTVSDDLINIMVANGGGEVSVGEQIVMRAASIYARNTCMLNYVRSKVGVCSDPDCLNYQDANNKRVAISVTGGWSDADGNNFGALTGKSLDEGLYGSCPVDGNLFCDDCLKHAKVYLSEYAANDALGFMEVMKVVQQTNDSYDGEDELDFGYYNDYIEAIAAVYGALADARGEDGCAVVSVFYRDEQVVLDCSPVELGAFYSGETATSSSSTEATNIVEVIAVKGADGTYTYTVSGYMTLDISGTSTGYIRVYEESADSLEEKTFGEIGVNAVSSQATGGARVEYGNLSAKEMKVSIQAGSPVGRVELNFDYSDGSGNQPRFTVMVRLVDSAAG